MNLNFNRKMKAVQLPFLEKKNKREKRENSNKQVTILQMLIIVSLIKSMKLMRASNGDITIVVD